MLSPYLTKFEKSRVPHPVATYHLTQGRGGQRGKGRGRLAPEFRRNSQRNSRSRPLLLARLSRNGALGLAIRRVVIQATFRVKGYLTLPLTLSLSLFSLCERFQASFIFFFYSSIFLPLIHRKKQEWREDLPIIDADPLPRLQITGNFVLFEV